MATANGVALACNTPALTARCCFRRSSFRRSLPGPFRFSTRDRLTRLVGLSQPIRNRRLDLIPMRDPCEIDDLCFRRPIDTLDLRRFDRPPQKQADFEITFPRPHEEIARLAGKHDRVMRRVDPLLAELDGRFAQPQP